MIGGNTINLSVPAAGGSIRLNESLEAIKSEFEAMANEVDIARKQKDDIEGKLGAQVNELNVIKHALYDLEAQHNKVRQSYEEELSRLRAELAAHARHTAPHPSTQGIAGLASSSGIHSNGVPPLGPGGPPMGPGGPGPNGSSYGPPDGYPDRNGRIVPRDTREAPILRDAPLQRDRDGNPFPRDAREPPLSREGRDPPPMRDRDPAVLRDQRERERERDRDAMMIDSRVRRDEPMGTRRERDRDYDMDVVPRDRDPRDLRDVRGPGDMVSRDGRDIRDVRERERERDIDRLGDTRDPKRAKKEGYSGGLASHTTTPRLPPSQHLYPGFSGPGAPGGPGAPSGPGGPPIGSPYASTAIAGAPHQASGVISNGPLKTEVSTSALGLGPPPPLQGPPQTSSALASLNEDWNYGNVSPEYRKEGPDWFAVFNPKIKKTLDINLVHSFQHSSVVCCVQFSQDGRFLATGCNQTAQIYDSTTGEKVCELPHETEQHSGDLYIRSVRFSPDGKLLATGAEDRKIRIWDIGRKCISRTFDGHQQEIYSLDFSANGRLIVSGSGDRTTRIWDMADNSSKIFTITDVTEPSADAGVTSVAISPNTALVAAGSLDNIIRIWDVSTGTLLERLRGHSNSVYSVAFTPDGKGLVTGSLDKTLKLWDVSHLGTAEGRRKAAENPDMRDRLERDRMERMEREGKVVQSANCAMDFIGHKDYVLSVSMSSDSRWVVSGSKDRCVHVWDSKTATLQLMLQGHKNSVISLDLNSNNDLLATGSGDSFARIWSLARI